MKILNCGMRKEELLQRTKALALRVMKMADSLPHKPSGRALSNQLVRSGTSVAANYRAACRARSKAEFIAKLQIVIEEADESLFWLELVIESGLVPSSKVEPLRKEADELTAIMVASRKTASKEP